MTSQQYIDLEYDTFVRHYEPYPLVLAKAEGVYTWDVEGNRYLDCLAGIGACNQGHQHPKVLKAFINQASNITLTSRAFHNTQLGEFGKYLTGLLGYDKFIPMNTGVEADETAIKIARRWAYRVKGVPDDQAMVLFPKSCFWGRSITACGACDDPLRKTEFGPFTPGFELCNWDDAEDLESRFKANPNICAFVLEPIQGEGGLNVPSDGYLTKVRALCTKYNVLMIADEIQTGFGRTGDLMACHHENVRPDIMVLGKSLGGGMVPVSGCVADNHIMDLIKPGDHGCTYGGNPLAMATAHAAVKCLVDEGMVENSKAMGHLLRSELRKIDSPLIDNVRGRGLFVGVQIKAADNIKVNGHNLVTQLRLNGVLTKNAANHSIRLMPPLTMNESQIMEVVEIAHKAFKDLEIEN